MKIIKPFFLLFIFSTKLGFSQTRTVDSLLTELKKQKEDTNKVKVLNGIAYEYGENDNKKAFDYGQRGYELATKLQYKKGIWNSCNIIARAVKFLGNIEDAIKWNQKALDIAEKNNLIIHQAHSYNNLALLMGESENYKKAEEYFDLSLKAYQKISNRRGYYSIYNNTGNLFYNQAEYLKGYRNFKEGFKIASELKDSSLIAQSLNNMGNVLYYLDKKDSSFICYRNAYNISKNHASKREAVNNGANYAYMLYERKEFNRAEELYLELLSIIRVTKDMNEISHVMSYMSKLYFDWDKYKLAYLYKDSAQKINSELLSEKNIKSINGLTALYENEKKELQISNLSKENEVQEEKLKRENIFKIVFAAGFILIGIFAVYLVYSLREKEKARKVIDLQKKILEEKQAEILDSIKYAKRIQNALLPSDKYLTKYTRSRKN